MGPSWITLTSTPVRYPLVFHYTGSLFASFCASHIKRLLSLSCYLPRRSRVQLFHRHFRSALSVCLHRRSKLCVQSSDRTRSPPCHWQQSCSNCRNSKVKRIINQAR